MRFTLPRFLFCASLGALFLGGKMVTVSFTNRHLTTLSCAQYLNSGSDARWLRLEDCYLSMAECLVRKLGDNVRQVYIPLRTPDQPIAGPVKILLSTERPGLTSIADDVGRCQTQEELLKLLKQNLNSINHQSVEGVVRFSWDNGKLRPHHVVLSPDVVVLDEGAKPESVPLIMLTFLGAAALGAASFWARRRSSEMPSVRVI